MIGFPPKPTVELDTREERFAARFAQLRGVTPPVDVEKLAKSLAIVSEKRFPIDIDGLCLDINTLNARPKIWINSRLKHQRRRFTLAHEIGHIIIPWHTGTIIDDLDTDDSNTTTEYFRMEGEANRFAAELLMPKHWVLELCQKASHLQAVMRTVTIVGDVSAQAAAIRVLQIGPPGYLMSAVENDAVSWSGQTKGTYARYPARGDHIETFAPMGFHRPEIFSLGRMKYYFWKEIDKLKYHQDRRKTGG